MFAFIKYSKVTGIQDDPTSLVGMMECTGITRKVCRESLDGIRDWSKTEVHMVT